MSSATVPMPAKIDLTDLSLPLFGILFAACFIVAAVPILAVATPPLFDYPNHLARMHILAAYDDSPALREFYAFDWRPIPNLAMDLVVPPLARLMPLAWAGKAFLLTTFFLIAGGTAALHRILFGRWSAWPCLAFFLLYNRLLLWGFVNFLFGTGLALLAAALWIGLRERPPWLRLPLACLLTLALYLAHVFALGTYAIVILGYEAARLHRQARLASLPGLGQLGLSLSQFIPAIALFIATHDAGSAGDIVWSRLVRKLDLLFNILDNYHPWFDIASFALLVGLFLAGCLGRVITMNRLMALPLVLLALAQLAMPNRLFGGAGVDHRMPLVLALLLIAASSVTTRDLARQRWIATLLALLFVARIGVVTATWVAHDRIYAPVVAALEALPPGSRLAVANPETGVHVSHRDPPMTHLASFAVVGADAFVPTLFTFPGQQPLRLRPPYAALASAATPEDFWAVFVKGGPDPGERVAAALSRYDFILFAADAPFAMGETARLEPRAVFANARLFAVRR